MRPRRTARNDQVLVCAKRSVGEHLLACFAASSRSVRTHRIGARGGRRGLALVRFRVQEAVAAWRASLGSGSIVVLNAGSEVYLLALLMRLWPASRHTRLIVADFLPSPHRVAEWAQGWVLRRADGWVCIRSGDIDMLVRRFGIERERCTFALWPLSFDPTDGSSVAGETRVETSYLYSGGDAYRDWKLVFDALEISPYPAVLSFRPDRAPEVDGRVPPPFTSVMPLLAPAHGRALARDAVIVIVALQDTDLAAGPTVLTDAMALGAPVVVTDTNGTRDYVIDGETARVVPSGDAPAMAAALSELLADDDRRDRLGSAAAGWAATNLRPEPFVRSVLALCSR